MSDVITLDSSSPAVQYLCNKDKRLAKVISQIGSISYTPHDDGYAFLVHEIIEQMLSIKAGAKIYERLIAKCNGKVTPNSVDKLSDEDLKSIGTSSSKVTYIKSLTKAIMNGQLNLANLEDMVDKDVIKQLTAVKGIGQWTAKMYLIFVLNRQDVLPYEDVAFLQSYEWLYKTNDRSKAAVEKKCKKWKPYSSIAARYLYRALDNGLTKTEFHLYK